MSSTAAPARVGEAIRGEFPILETTDLPQRVLAGRALASRPRGLRGVPRRLGRERRRVGALGRAGRGGARRRSRALLHATPDELAVTTSVSQGVSGIVSALDLGGPPQDRDLRLRVPDRRADRACAGAARSRDRPRPTGRGRDHPGRGVRRRDRRAHRPRVLHDDLLSHRPSPGRRARSPRIAHDRGALVLADSYQAVGAIDLDAPALGVDFVTGGTVKYLLASRRPRLPLRPRPGCSPTCCRRRPAGSPTRTSSGWTSPTTRPRPTPGASTPALRRCRTSTRASRAWRSSRRRACATIEAHVRDLNTRLIAGAHDLGRDRRHPRRPGPCAARSSASPRAMSPRSSPSSPTSTSTVSSRDGNLRVAAHLYNTEEDVDRLLAALAARRHLLA